MLCDAEPGQPPTFDFVLPAGSTLSFRFVWKTGNPAAPVDLTGYTARLIMRAPGQTDVELSSANGRIVLGGANGTIDLNMPAAQTAALAPHTWDYQLVLSAGAYAHRLTEGRVTITPTL